MAQVVYEAGLPTPAAGDTVEVEGRLGIVYERVDGPSMLEEVTRHPWMLPSVARQFADLHLAMHKRVEMGLPSGREQMDDWGPLMAAAYLGQGLTPQEDDKLIALIEAALGG